MDKQQAQKAKGCDEGEAVEKKKSRAGRKAPMPKNYFPMLATLVDKLFMRRMVL